MLKRDKVIFVVLLVQIAGAAVYSVARSHRMNGGTVPPRRVFLDADMLIGSKTQILGRRNTPYTLVEFADYQCPPCARANLEIKKILSNNPASVNFCFRNFPLPSHSLARPAAIIAERYRSTDQFWRIHDRMFAGQDTFSVETISNMESDLKDTRKSEAMEAVARVDSDRQMGVLASVQGTPTFFLCKPNGEVFEVQSLQQVEQLLRRRD